MGKRKVVFLGLLVVVLLAGLLPVSIAVAASAQHSTADVTVKASGELAGESTLVRNANGISFTIKTTKLVPGNAYSVWIKVFEDDFKDGPGKKVDGTIVVANSGGIAGKDGHGNFAGSLAIGTIGEADGEKIVSRGDGTFDTPFTSRVKLVVRDHGPKIPGQVNDQTHTKNSGCREGEPNETPTFECTSVQSAVHKP